MRKLLFLASLLILGLAIAANAASDDGRGGPTRQTNLPSRLVPVGAAKADITPEHPVRLSGYGGRRTESEGVAQRIWAKALALGGDAGDGPAVLISVENCTAPARLTDAVAAKLKERFGLQRPRLVVCATHTHCAPHLGYSLPFMFNEPLPAEHKERVDRYARQLEDRLVEAAAKAISARRPARLAWAQGQVGFAMNRRSLKGGRSVGIGRQPGGPVDHSLPVLAAEDAEGKLIAVLANYACHCTTLGGDFNKICGDWAGCAQEFIEQDHPGAIAMISIGCGADANPNPRGKLEMCSPQGRALADEVSRLLRSGLKPVAPPLRCQLEYVQLPFAELPTKQQWRERAAQLGAAGLRARAFLESLERGDAIPAKLRYPVAVWTFSDDLAMIFLAGEVVVDYSLMLKSQFDSSRLWITAYANDAPCYIPSKRILSEGGYEADQSMIYYGQPAPLRPETEDLIIGAVKKLLPPQFK